MHYWNYFYWDVTSYAQIENFKNQINLNCFDLKSCSFAKTHWSTSSVTIEQQGSGQVLYLRVFGALTSFHTSRLNKKLLGTLRVGLQVQDNQTSA